MMTTKFVNFAEYNDADLVTQCLEGSREAFHAIVERYQNLLCSLAYNATGNLSQSEDVAQETFLTVWTELRSLREPEKLRSWLCGILRNRVRRHVRGDGREPVCGATPLEDAPEPAMTEALPSEQAITREEEEIMWRALSRIPESYREPLILFYRQHQSVEQVAQSLDLTEDAAKQRLSRGRKLLQEEVHSFVEKTLSRSAPSHVFSSAVLAALPTNQAATIGAGVLGKGAAGAKAGAFGAMLLPFVGFFAGFASQWMVVHTTSPKSERGKKLFQLVVTWICLLGIPILGEMSVQALSDHFAWDNRGRFIAETLFWSGWCFILAAWLVMVFRRELVLRQKIEASLSPSQMPAPMSLKQAIFVALGGYLTVFGWLVVFAWRQHDQTAAGLLTGAACVLAIWNFMQLRGKSGVAATRISFAHLTLCCAIVLFVVNLRLDVWLAAAEGLSIAAIHNIFPLWMAPTATLALCGWIALLLARTKNA
jgi:RNA polymerase sigma factor (sigma-70 family)